VRSGKSNPFEQPSVIITSFQFANRRRSELRLIALDMVIIDEAHKLRNVYRKSNKMGKGIKWALDDYKKLLLTATPLQNSLLELYGLSTLIDDRIFGDRNSFRSQYMNNKAQLDDLKERLNTFVHRTLRSQVLEYIRYTERISVTHPFTPTDSEQYLYNQVSDFLLKEDTYAIPNSQKVLITLIIRKLLASSSYALTGTLETIKSRLEKLYESETVGDNWLEEFVIHDEMEQDLIDENDLENENKESDTTRKIDLNQLKDEINDLDRLINLAKSIQIDSKSQALVKSLQTGFQQMEEMGAKTKALIFTESRRTQQYLKGFLESNGFAGKVVLFNGTNNDENSNEIYKQWLEKYANTDKVSGSKSSDKRASLVEHFQKEAQIMIATESAAEGVNLQFYSLVINYDLPWNPQRIEQRIGRCHRYGQKHDVVVINFLNERNEADQRVYELLKEKFNLFTGVLGSSDEVLGNIESGVDFEKRILSIYQRCRTTEEIEAAFKELQMELEEEIEDKMKDTRKAILENFDADVHSRLKINLEDTKYELDRFSKMFWTLTKVILYKEAIFDNEDFSFNLLNVPSEIKINKGKYELISKEKKDSKANLYRLSHPLGEYVLDTAKSSMVPTNKVVFNISNHPVRISVIESLKGKSGYLTLTKLTIESYEKEEYLLFNGITDNNEQLDQEICEKLFQCVGQETTPNNWSEGVKKKLLKDANHHIQATINQSLENNNKYFQEESDRLERWADDLILASEKELQETKAKIKEAKRQARKATSTESHHDFQKEIKQLEQQQRKQRRQIFDVEDEIMDKRDELIDELEKKMVQETTKEELFTIQWKVI